MYPSSVEVIMANNPPSSPYVNQLLQLRRLVDEQKDAQNRELQTWWRQLVGVAVEEMLNSRDAAERHLRNSNPAFRDVALQVLTYHWQPTETFAIACEDMMMRDPDLDVRHQAVCSIAACHLGTNNRMVGQLLAGMVRNIQEEDDIRRAAYQSLLLVRGLRDPQFEARCRAGDSISFRDDINWTIVDSSQ
jgi:hypothetical protein